MVLLAAQWPRRLSPPAIEFAAWSVTRRRLNWLRPMALRQSSVRSMMRPYCTPRHKPPMPPSRQPAEISRCPAAHAAVGAKREHGYVAAPGCDCLLGAPRLRRAKAKTRRDGCGDFTQRLLAALDVHERASGRFGERQEVKRCDIGDVHVGPSVEPASDIAHDA